jgi:dienelactone hydrolase
VDAGVVQLSGALVIPRHAQGLVLFAHGSGSSRLSPRNQYVAEVLHQRRIGTLLFDLLTKEEEAEDASTGKLRFDIEFLAKRLVAATDWVQKNPKAKGLRLGYFGASTGAAAALAAAAQRKDIAAIVSRGGRPDLAERSLPWVRAPTLLIVGGDDTPVIDMNEHALARLNVDKQLVLVPGASHLFEEPGALEKVAELASGWFTRHLRPNEDQSVFLLS